MNVQVRSKLRYYLYMSVNISIKDEHLFDILSGDSIYRYHRKRNDYCFAVEPTVA